MADPGIKKVIVSTSKLGLVNSNNEYLLRYRVVSEDKNRMSHWSPNYSISGLNVAEVDGDINIVGNTVFCAWEDEVLRPGYDIFVGIDGATPTYHGTTPIHTYSFLKTSGTTVRVVVQIESIKKELSQDLKVYDSL